jgi:GGDEF domain-containing protein
MPDLDASDGRARADRLARRLNGHMVDYLGTALRIEASVGMFAYDGSNTSAEIMAEADRNMYQEKSARRGRRAA